MMLSFAFVLFQTDANSIFRAFGKDQMKFIQCWLLLTDDISKSQSPSGLQTDMFPLQDSQIGAGVDQNGENPRELNPSSVRDKNLGAPPF